MIIYDRDGEIEIEVRDKRIKIGELAAEQVAAKVAEALGEQVFWLDRSGAAEQKDDC